MQEPEPWSNAQTTLRTLIEANSCCEQRGQGRNCRCVPKDDEPGPQPGPEPRPRPSPTPGPGPDEGDDHGGIMPFVPESTVRDREVRTH